MNSRCRKLASWLTLVAITASSGFVLESPSSATPGVSRRRIKIGVHAPFTGAVPLPSNSIQEGAEVHWKWRRARRRPIRRRHVSVIVKNDNYNPSQAVAVCKEMVERDGVFMLSGLMSPEGKDQVQACARYAAAVGVPYVSLGTTKIGLKGLPNYLAFSMPWPEQARLLADFFIARLRARRRQNGMVRFNSPNYEDSHDSFIRRMENRRARVHYDRAISRGSGTAEANAVIAEMDARGIDNVFVLVSPIFFIQLLRAADDQNYHPRWTGIGITMSINDEIVEAGCPSIRGARFFSPIPAFVDRNEFDRSYGRAMRRLYSERGDAISWLGWATSRPLAKLLNRAGRKLTRKRFIRRAERSRLIKTGVLPRIRFRPRDQFGGLGTHVLAPNCRDERWHTRARFKQDF
jgi:branched-chain amino acid transport system substrate-binding protein